MALTIGGSNNFYYGYGKSKKPEQIIDVKPQPRKSSESAYKKAYEKAK